MSMNHGSTGHRFERTDASGHAEVQQGDRYNTNYQISHAIILPASERQSLPEFLDYETLESNCRRHPRRDGNVLSGGDVSSESVIEYDPRSRDTLKTHARYVASPGSSNSPNSNVLWHDYAAKTEAVSQVVHVVDLYLGLGNKVDALLDEELPPDTASFYLIHRDISNLNEEVSLLISENSDLQQKEVSDNDHYKLMS